MRLKLKNNYEIFHKFIDESEIYPTGELDKG